MFCSAASRRRCYSCLFLLTGCADSSRVSHVRRLSATLSASHSHCGALLFFFFLFSQMTHSPCAVLAPRPRAPRRWSWCISSQSADLPVTSLSLPVPTRTPPWCKERSSARCLRWSPSAGKNPSGLFKCFPHPRLRPAPGTRSRFIWFKSGRGDGDAADRSCRSCDLLHRRGTDVEGGGAQV